MKLTVSGLQIRKQIHNIFNKFKSVELAIYSRYLQNICCSSYKKGKTIRVIAFMTYRTWIWEKNPHYFIKCKTLELTLQGRQLNTKLWKNSYFHKILHIGYNYDKSNLGWPHCTHCEPVWHKTSTAALSLTLALL